MCVRERDLIRETYRDKVDEYIEISQPRARLNVLVFKRSSGDGLFINLIHYAHSDFVYESYPMLIRVMFEFRKRMKNTRDI